MDVSGARLLPSRPGRMEARRPGPHARCTADAPWARGGGKKIASSWELEAELHSHHAGGFQHDALRSYRRVGVCLGSAGHECCAEFGTAYVETADDHTANLEAAAFDARWRAIVNGRRHDGGERSGVRERSRDRRNGRG